jgi:hypothetical protein
MSGWLVSIGLGAAGLVWGAGAEPVVVRFRETNEAFANPGKGWMCGGGTRTPRFPCSVVYTRFNWVDLEPEEGRFQWARIDAGIASAQSRGATLAFRIMTTNAHSRGYYASPKWLFDAGCKGFEYVRGGDDPTSGGARIPRIEPDYADPVYLAKHGSFIRALARRYDGHAGVEFLDVGSYGIWGEWHTKNAAPWAVRKQIIDWYLEGFGKTPLAMMSDDAEAMAYALPKGAGFRRDGVGSPWHEKNWIGSAKYKDVAGFAEAWTRAPAVFEWYGDYAYLQKREWSFERAVDFMLANHVTLINDNVGRVPEEATPRLLELARRSGYRFVLREASHAEKVKRGGAVEVKMKWANVGVGRLYRAFALELYLIDGAGKVAAKARAAADPRTWLPGEWEATGRIEVGKGLGRGEYGIAVAMVDGQGKARIKFAMDAPESDRVYRVSSVRVE